MGDSNYLYPAHCGSHPIEQHNEANNENRPKMLPMPAKELANIKCATAHYTRDIIVKKIINEHVKHGTHFNINIAFTKGDAHLPIAHALRLLSTQELRFG